MFLELDKPKVKFFQSTLFTCFFTRQSQFLNGKQFFIWIYFIREKNTHVCRRSTHVKLWRKMKHFFYFLSGWTCLGKELLRVTFSLRTSNPVHRLPPRASLYLYKTQTADVCKINCLHGRYSVSRIWLCVIEGIALLRRFDSFHAVLFYIFSLAIRNLPALLWSPTED